MPDYSESQRAAIDFRGEKLLVSAAAGSGKTRVLVGRVLDRVERERLDLEDFLVITFTRAAAAELRDRFSKEIGERAAKGDRHMRRQLTASKENITTIDAFCAAIVREYAHLTDVAGRRVLTDGELSKLREQARASALERVYSSADDDIEAAISALGYDRADNRFAEAVEKIYDHTREHPFPQTWRDTVIREYSAADFSQTEFGETLAKSAISLVDGGVMLLEKARELARSDGETFAKVITVLESDIECAKSARQALADGHLAAASELLNTENGRFSTPRGLGDDPLKERIKSLRDAWKDKIKARAAKLVDGSDGCSAELRTQFTAIRGLLKAAEIFGEELDRVKASRRAADFSDYTHAAVDLLASPLPDGGYEPSAVARAVSAKFREVLVDEFQDTNEIQTFICDLLCAEQGHSLFMVGDVKQSIYRFRLARPDIFLRRYESYPPLSEGKDTAVQDLSQNFRSRAEVLGSVNYFFRRIMTGGASEINYDANQYLYAGRTDEPRPECTTEFCILDASAGDDTNTNTADRTALEAEYVAGRVAELLREGFPVKDGDIERPIRPEDIAILLRSPKDRAWLYRQALDNLGIPCDAAADDGIGAELMTLLSVLTAIDNPYLDVTLVGAMLSPVFGFTADELARLRASARYEPTVYGSVLSAARAGDAKAAEFVEKLKEYRRSVGMLSVDKFLLKLYAESGIVGVYSAMEGGAVRRERLNLVYSKARQYAKQSRYGLHGFIEYFESAITRGEFASNIGGGEGVRVMSVHGSKGLEFAVVFYSSLGSRFNLQDTQSDLLLHPELGIAMKIFDRERRYIYPSGAWSAAVERLRRETIAEELRIMYVAMTRAKEKLILTCVLPDAEKKLVNMLAKPWLGESSLATTLAPAEILIPLAAEHPNGAVLRAIASSDEVCALEPTDGALNVRVIGLRREDGTARTEQFERTVEAGADADVYDTLRRNLEYAYPAPELAELPSKLTATQLKGLRDDEQEDIIEPSDEDEPRRRFVFQKRRPRFVSENSTLTPTERGTAIHTAMQFADYAACATEDGAIAEIDRLEREKYLTAVQADAVRKEIDKVCGFATSDLCRRALASDDLRREFKFSILDDASRYFPAAPDGEKVLLQGVCDMFFVENGGVTVVDFKSDRVSVSTERQRAAEYAPQLDAYAHALERIFTKPVKRRVIYFFATGHEIEV